MTNVDDVNDNEITDQFITSIDPLQVYKDSNDTMDFDLGKSLFNIFDWERLLSPFKEGDKVYVHLYITKEGTTMETGKINEINKKPANTTSNKTVELPLGENIPNARIILERAGQANPSYSDEVMVRALILLPTEEGKPSLHSDIQFGDRVEIAGDTLHNLWGDLYEVLTEYRYGLNYFTSTKWADAFEKAEDWATTEVQKLIVALENRRKALQNAE